MRGGDTLAVSLLRGDDIPGSQRWFSNAPPAIIASRPALTLHLSQNIIEAAAAKKNLDLNHARAILRFRQF
jgi:hypothetical protein